MTTKAVIDDLGARVDWRVRRLTRWVADFQGFTSPGVPQDISGATITAVITANSTSSTALKTFTTTLTAATDGRWRISLADSAADLAVGTYWWAMELDTGSGDEPIMSGEFTVEPWVVA